jgi:hypothetical protein
MTTDQTLRTAARQSRVELAAIYTGPPQRTYGEIVRGTRENGYRAEWGFFGREVQTGERVTVTHVSSHHTMNGGGFTVTVVAADGTSLHGVPSSHVALS